ncbi:hypothetical protein ACN4EE_02960 [Geminocystis sp. CENA526]|uniref:hypothetical protein n=1 Tax=Geminocystis sp. CENA526 TaxID=1355871 RepID=UPI003D6E82F4
MLFKIILSLVNLFTVTAVMAQQSDFSEKSAEFDLEPSIIENSPVIREWIKEIPDVSDKIIHQPSFRTRYRLGYTEFPSNKNSGGFFVGVEDIFIGNTPLTFSAKYSQDLSNSDRPQFDRLSVGANLQYYLLPLGSYVNIAPVLGYRYIETAGYNTGGVNVGVRLGLIFSPQGAGDIFITQSFVSPTGNEEVGITEINVGYAVTKNLRLATEIGWQNSIKQNDSQISVGFEWMR